jgi:phenylacetate-CoA ligase
VATSGTTAEKVTNVWYQPWWDASEKMSWQYNSCFGGLEYGREPEAILTSPRNTGIPSDDADLGFQERRVDRFLYLNERSSPVLWDNSHMDRMIKELAVFQPSILEANPAYLARLALHAYKTGQNIWQPKVIVLTYENPLPFLREQISLVFSSPQVSSFGSTEAAYVLTECECGRLHQNARSCRLDIQPFNRRFGRLDYGRLLVTTFDNPWRYLLRFDTGDLVKVASSCPCGRNDGFIIEEIAGRTTNITFSAEGSLILPSDVGSVMETIEDLISYRVMQNKDRNLTVELETDSVSCVPQDEVISALDKLYGNVDIQIKHLPMISAENSGKFKLTGTDYAWDHQELFGMAQNG